MASLLKYRQAAETVKRASERPASGGGNDGGLSVERENVFIVVGARLAKLYTVLLCYYCRGFRIVCTSSVGVARAHLSRSFSLFIRVQL